MINLRIQNIKDIIGTFTGKDGEPSNDTEFYILKAMWVMMVSEFEGSTKGVVEAYIDRIKTSSIDQIHVCLLLQNFHPNSEDDLTINKIISIHKKNPKEINYTHFTRDKKPKYKEKSVEKLFNTLGIFFTKNELSDLKTLDGIASTRNSIAHGDSEIQITRKELEKRLSEVEKIFQMLKAKLVA